jgi:hypothetical protein
LLVVPTRTPTQIPIDIELSSLEITQTIQCMNDLACADNSVPLYTGKATLVRAYVRIASGPMSIGGISGALCLGEMGSDGCSVPIRPTSPVTVQRVSDPVGAWRGDLKYTLNFVLPYWWVSDPIHSKLTVYVNYRGENTPETNLDNNRKVLPLDVGASRPMDVVFVTMRSNAYTSDLAERWKLVGWLQRVYPTSDIRVWELPVMIVENYDFKNTDPPGCGAGWNLLLVHLKWLRAGRSQLYFGMVDVRSRGDSGFGGCGYTPGGASAGLVGIPNRIPGEIAAQELGHNFGRPHAPGCEAGKPDGGFPDGAGAIDEYGVDITRMQLYRAGFDFDFMGYCGGEGNTWISLYTYRLLAGKLAGAYVPSRGPRLASVAAAEHVPFLIGSGLISPEGVTIEDGFYRIEAPASARDDPASGPYALELRDAQGTTLATYSFRQDELSNHEPGVAGPFHLMVPWAEGVEALVFTHDGLEVGRREASAHAPSVTVRSPNGGEAWGLEGSETIAWEASDEDGDPLSFIVQYSPDGSSWVTLAANLTGTSLEVDEGRFPGGGAARVRVIATDGLRTAQDESDTGFQVERKPPDAAITSIDDGQHFPSGTTLILRGAATDPEQGPLTSAEALAWSSSDGGELGQGSFLTLAGLAVGEHTIQLEAVDADGMVARDSVTIVIDPPEEPVAQVSEPTQSARPPLGLWLTICGLALVLLAGGGWLLMRRRQT